MRHEEVKGLLEGLYEKCLTGIPGVSSSVRELAEDYLEKDPNIDVSAKKFIGNQIMKCTTSGFLTGLGGIVTLPVAVPANISSVLYVQMRMIACVAYMGGYDVSSDQVKTLIYACLAGVSVNRILKANGIKFGTKLSKSMINKIPGKVILSINKKVGFRFVTKFGQKGTVNLVKVVPFVGGVIGGSFDFVETKIIGDRAYKMFILGELDLEHI